MGERQTTDQQGPLVHFRRQQRPDGVVSFESGGEDAGHQEFGRLGSQRRQPLDEKKLVDPKLLATLHQRVGKRRGGRQNESRGGEKQKDDHEDPGSPGKTCHLLGDPHQIGLSLFLLGHPPQINAEQCEQESRVEKRDAPGERDDEGVEPGHRKQAKLDTSPRIEHNLGNLLLSPSRCEPEDQHDNRPPDSDQKAVASRHVGRGVLGKLWAVPGRVGKVQVNRVLRQHGDERKHSSRKARGDIHLGRLRCPGQQERGCDHSGSEEQHGQCRGNRELTQSHHESRNSYHHGG